jgi:hypothetical protein
MRTTLGCLSFALMAMTGCGLFDDGSSKNQSLTTDERACSELDEASCVARSDCEAQYVEWGCACPECVPGGDCPPCDCDGQTGREFAGCSDRDPCAGLDEMTCVATEGCTPIYGGYVCEVPCIENPDGSVDCPPCGDPTISYQGCTSEPIVTDPCAGLGEQECLALPECEAVYGDAGGRDGVAPPSDPTDPNSPIAPPPSGFLYCQERKVCPAVACDIYCEWGNVIGPDGCEICECNPPPACADLPEDVCLVTAGCEPEYIEPCTQVCNPDGECWNCTADGVCHPLGEDCECSPIFAGCHEIGCGDR